MPIKDSELILNPDGSVYHLNLKPEQVANTVIFVGDQEGQFGQYQDNSMVYAKIKYNF